MTLCERTRKTSGRGPGIFFPPGEGLYVSKYLIYALVSVFPDLSCTAYHQLVDPMPNGVTIHSAVTDSTDMVHLFCTQRTDLASALNRTIAQLRPDAAVWVSWPKKASKVLTDITEDTIREVALPLGLVDIKVCAVDEIWSGLKLVIRKENRAGQA